MGDIAFFFMRRPAYGSLLFHSMRAARRVGGKNFPYSIAQARIRKYAAYGMEGG